MGYTFHKIERLIQIEDMVTAIDAVRPKKFVFHGELHDFWEMVFVKDGCATATADERVYRLPQGRLLFHEPMVFHRIWSEDDSEPHLLLLSFRASGAGMRSFESRCFDLTLPEQEQLEGVFHAVSLALSDVTHPDYAARSTRAAVLLESFLLGISERKTPKPTPLSTDERHYREIVNVMNDHCRENLSVGELAALCRMGVSNMKRVFNRYSDTGIAKYFLMLKLRSAMELLDEGRTAAEISEELGFSSVSYFYVVFKREMGTTPRDYCRRRRL